MQRLHHLPFSRAERSNRAANLPSPLALPTGERSSRLRAKWATSYDAKSWHPAAEKWPSRDLGVIGPWNEDELLQRSDKSAPLRRDTGSANATPPDAVSCRYCKTDWKKPQLDERCSEQRAAREGRGGLVRTTHWRPRHTCWDCSHCCHWRACAFKTDCGGGTGMGVPAHRASTSSLAPARLLHVRCAPKCMSREPRGQPHSTGVTSSEEDWKARRSCASALGEQTHVFLSYQSPLHLFTRFIIFEDFLFFLCNRHATTCSIPSPSRLHQVECAQ